MKQESSFSRYDLIWMIVLCYLLPLISLIAFSSFYTPQFSDWHAMSMGLMLAAFGTLILFWRISRLEKMRISDPCSDTLKTSYNNPDSEDKPIIDFQEYDLTKRSLDEAQQMQIRLLSEIDILNEEIAKLSSSKTEILNAKERLEEELDSSKLSTKNQMEKQQTYIRELQRTIVDQKTHVEKKQQHILQLETKVGDLTNEIKTLLQFAEARTNSLLSNEIREPITESVQPLPLEEFSIDNYIKTTQEASIQLNHCLDIAQKIKGSQRFGSQIYSFLDSPADNFSLDLRRLCDRLRGEAESTILLYSPQDSQLLFCSNRIKSLTGWSPEKFSQNFLELLTNELEWKQGISSLMMRSEADIELQLRTRSGSPLKAKAVLGIIPTGIFRDHVIAVLY